MNIAIVGATGFVGAPLTAEALARGHAVTAIARDPARLRPHAGLTPCAVDLRDPAAARAALAGHDAVLLSVKYTQFDFEAFLAAVKAAEVPRLLAVGGAGSLELPSGEDLVDTPDFPGPYRAEALAAREALHRLRGEEALDWTYLSPSGALEPGPRGGHPRLGGDALLVDAQGRSRITVGDLAAVLVDELERPRHSRRRFTAGY